MEISTDTIPTIIQKFGILAAYLTQTYIFISYVKGRDKDNFDLHNKSEARMEKITNKCIQVIEENTVSNVELRSSNSELKNTIELLKDSVFYLEKKVNNT